VGIRATKPNEAWHVDTTIIKLLDGTTAYLHAAIDNYSRKILAWTVADTMSPSSTYRVLVDAAKQLPVLATTVILARAANAARSSRGLDYAAVQSFLLPQKWQSAAGIRARRLRAGRDDGAVDRGLTGSRSPPRSRRVGPDARFVLGLERS
jgi:transposase InsO family protein